MVGGFRLFSIAKKWQQPKNADTGITFHSYGKKEDKGQGAIDFIFTSKGVKADTYKVIRNTVMDMYPSDHYPIVADVIV